MYQKSVGVQDVDSGKSVCSYILPYMHIKIYDYVNSLIICEGLLKQKNHLKNIS